MTDPNVKFRYVSRNVRDSANRVLKSLSGQGRKRKRGESGKQSSIETIFRPIASVDSVIWNF